MKFLEYINEASIDTKLLETSACIGIVAPKSLIKKIDNLLLDPKPPFTITPFCEDIIEDIQSLLYKPYDWSSGGIRSVRNKLFNIKELYKICCIIKGMNLFVSDVVNFSNPKFIHNSILDFYHAEEKWLDKGGRTKHNTADCIITNASSVTSLLDAMSNNLPQTNEQNGYVIVGKYMYFQVSLKAEGRLGKLTTAIPSPPTTTVRDELIKNESFMDFLGSFKSFFSNINSKIKSFSRKMHNILFSTKKKADDDIYKEIISLYGKSITEARSKPEVPLWAQMVEVVSNNPRVVYKKIDKDLDDVDRMLKSTDIDHIIKRITKVPTKITGSEEYIRLEVLKIAANLVGTRLLKDMLSNADSLVTNINSMNTEMMFGNTKFPLWKVYPYDGSSKTYEYLGTPESYTLQHPAVTIDPFGVKIYPTKNEPHYQIKLFLIASIEEDGKWYNLGEIRSFRGHEFSVAAEVSKVKGPYPLDKDLLDIMNGIKD